MFLRSVSLPWAPGVTCFICHESLQTELAKWDRADNGHVWKYQFLTACTSEDKRFDSYKFLDSENMNRHYNMYLSLKSFDIILFLQKEWVFGQGPL